MIKEVIHEIYSVYNTLCGGVKPKYFPLWLLTCKYNSDIDFLLFTDDKAQYDYPKNVKVYYMEWDEMKALFQQKFDFPLALDKPYKFCDFKPAYGDVFSEYLTGYDYWGHCDIDLFWGNIRKFVTDEVLEKYDRIYSRGHCSIYRNESRVNTWYKNLPNKGCQDWKKVFSKQGNYAFDEWAGHCGGGMSQIIAANGIEIYDEPDMADLAVPKARFKVNRWKTECARMSFCWEKGKLWAVNKNGIKIRETLYVHFQKRKITVNGYNPKTEDIFFLNAPGIVEGCVRCHTVKEMEFCLQRLWRRFKYLCLPKTYVNKLKKIIKKNS